jgi:CRISPR/Cas system endoribonuclease Cas6 (RAMP superfamily)
MNAHHSRYSLFTFDLRPRRPVFLEEGWKSRDGVWYFRFASARPEVSALVFMAFVGAGRFDLGCGVFALREVYKEPLSDRVVFYVSPVLAAKLKERGFWTPDEPEFGEAVARSLVNRWEFWTGRKADGVRFQFVGKPVRKLVQYRNRNLLAFGGMARLEAPRELRLFAQLVGLGQKPSCGFGYLA